MTLAQLVINKRTPTQPGKEAVVNKHAAQNATYEQKTGSVLLRFLSES
jgi:hypothetical protein